MWIRIAETETVFGINVIEHLYHHQLTLVDYFLDINLLSFAIILLIQDFQIHFAASAL